MMYDWGILNVYLIDGKWFYCGNIFLLIAAKLYNLSLRFRRHIHQICILNILSEYQSTNLSSSTKWNLFIGAQMATLKNNLLFSKICAHSLLILCTLTLAPSRFNSLKSYNTNSRNIKYIVEITDLFCY